MNYKKESEEIINIAQSLYAKGLLAAADGNISCLVEENKVLITPSGCSKAKLKPEQMTLVGLDGKVYMGKPSSELKMHLAIYNNCPKAKAVVHAHPPIATAWSIANPHLKELPGACLSELILACGSIPFVPFAFPGTEEMGNNLLKFLPKHRVMILARHGGLTWGESLEEAHRGMERLEHTAQVLYYAKNLGGLTELPTEQVIQLKTMRKKIGEISL